MRTILSASDARMCCGRHIVKKWRLLAMNLRWRITSLLIALFLCAAALPAQTNRSAPAVGSVEGRILGISRTGDLKPARMPTIYLLYKGQGEHLDPNSADQQ